MVPARTAKVVMSENASSNAIDFISPKLAGIGGLSNGEKRVSDRQILPEFLPKLGFDFSCGLRTVILFGLMTNRLPIYDIEREIISRLKSDRRLILSAP